MAPVVANSLSSVTQIAESPPLNLRSSVGPKRPSLVLYISRVPGSRDVILTPMKPSGDNVTEGDVISSLYYLHLDLPSTQMLKSPDELGHGEVDLKPDELSTTSTLLHSDSPETNAAGNISGFRPGLGTYNVPRKPLSRTSDQLRVSIEPSSPSLPPVFSPPFTTVHHSLPSSQALLPLAHPAPDSSAPPFITRRPLGPRPLTSQVQIKRRSLSNGSASFGTSNRTEAKATEINTRANGPKVENIRTVFDTSLTSKIPKTETPLSITLIRRDPLSGDQWNVGKISSQPISGMTLPTAANSSWLQNMSSLWLHLSTPGYDRFQRAAAIYRDDGHRAVMSQTEPSSPRTGFYRQISMEWSSLWGHSFKRHFRGLSDSASSKGEWAGSNTVIALDQSQNVYQSQRPAQDKGLKGKGCFFLSPWNGQCEFFSSKSGRSLKCKHTSSSGNGRFKNPSTAVSELRFNLPSASVSKSSGNPRLRAGGSSDAKQDNFHRVVSNSAQLVQPQLPPTSYAAMYPSDDSSESDGGMGLSLGREKAGGGSKGERVKLGKLIIHDEGLNMLDLVVAANMGIWWRVWEKRSNI